VEAKFKSEKGDAMKNAVSQNQKQTAGGKDNAVQAGGQSLSQVELFVEELEEVIAPIRVMNHNETLARDAEDIELDVEELEEVIAPATSVRR
jgi:hypothetical protein